MKKRLKRKTTIRTVNGWHIDANNNRWDAELYTAKDAEKLSKTMINSSDCVDSERCRNCIDCVKCFGCSDCRECLECTGLQHGFRVGRSYTYIITKNKVEVVYHDLSKKSRP